LGAFEGELLGIGRHRTARGGRRVTTAGRRRQLRCLPERATRGF